MNTKKYVIVDLGASNGRVLLGSYDGKKMYIETLIRFENSPVLAAGVSRWDILYLFEGIKKGINLAIKK